MRELAPEVPIDNPWSRTDPVRIAHLLEHSAGFDDMHFRNMNTDAPIPDSLEAIVRGLEHELRVRWQPGVKHSYSNPGYAVAGYLVEKVSGRPFHEYLQEK
ncbi:MAG: beta-lactamase family protein, partial [Proteobacteria bacterium]|nr:beta-lactamase family protein [Pseudomonadota bacterium]